MPSSTFNSEPISGNSRGTWASAVLLLVLLVLSTGIELLCRFGVPRISRIERRTQVEYQDLLDQSDRPYAAHGIVVGNSLLVAGVQFEDLKRRLLPDIDFKRFAVEDTGYFDWKYGMRRLFSCGVRPDVIVVVMTPRQFIITGVRGEYFAYHLMNFGDVLSVGRDVGASNTLISDLAFSNLSAFGGIRAEVRKLAAAALVPDLPRLTGLMTRHTARPMDADVVRLESERRLMALKELAGQYHARVILAIPPEGAKAGDTMASVVQEAGAAAGVSVLVPVAPGSMPDKLFADGFHLNEQGAKLFTSRLVQSLQAAIAPQAERRVSDQIRVDALRM